MTEEYITKNVKINYEMELWEHIDIFEQEGCFRTKHKGLDSTKDAVSQTYIANILQSKFGRYERVITDIVKSSLAFNDPVVSKSDPIVKDLLTIITELNGLKILDRLKTILDRTYRKSQYEN